MAEVGRPTNLTDELLMEIKELVLSGHNLKEIASIKEIPLPTLYIWHSDNYKDLYNKIEGWKRDRKLMLADKNIDGILQLDIHDKDFVKTVSDMSKFVKEVLDKPYYSKRVELTGKDGGALIPVSIDGVIAEKNAINGITTNNS